MSPASPFAIADYRFYWVARLASTIAQMSMVIVIGWQVYDIARATMSIREAAFQLGLIGLVQFVPLFILTPISGWTAEVFVPYPILQAFRNVPPQPGMSWRANFYRMDYDHGQTGWNWAPVGRSFHEYQKFGTLVFE